MEEEEYIGTRRNILNMLSFRLPGTETLPLPCGAAFLVEVGASGASTKRFRLRGLGEGSNECCRNRLAQAGTQQNNPFRSAIEVWHSLQYAEIEHECQCRSCVIAVVSSLRPC